jgi:hypothetical protein
MLEVRSSSLIEVSREVFPVVVDYQQGVYEAWSRALRCVKSWGNVELIDKVFPNSQLGKPDFYCRYAVLRQSGRLEDLGGLGLNLADMMQLFAFVCMYAETEVTAQNPCPIVADLFRCKDVIK